MDFKLASSVGLQQIRNWLPGGVQRGREWVALNPKRPGDTRLGSFSINLDTGIWSDFADSSVSGGDAVSLYAYLHDLSMLEAAKTILSESGVKESDPPQTPVSSANSGRKYDTIYPAPDTAGKPNMHHNSFGSPSKTWEYKTADGKTLFYICRYDAPGQRKQFAPWSYTPDGWRTIGHTDPRPLFNLDLLAKFPDKKVLAVEGEKCAEIGTMILDDFVVTCWPNGSSSVGKVDWSPLTGRDVYYWPDNDDAGYKAANSVDKIVRKIAKSFNQVRVPKDKPTGWDLADAVELDGMSAEDVLGIINNRAQDSPVEFERRKLPYTPLGYDHTVLYFLSGITHEVIAMSPSALSRKSSLFQLAPLDYWETEYPTKSGINIDLVCNDLIQQCNAVGAYDVGRTRGRGAWYDRGRIVLHLGDRLVVDGVTMSTDDIESRYIYESKPRIGNTDAIPLTAKEAVEVIYLMELVNFNKTASPRLLAGWCMLATICGSLEWRPHVWLTGPAGSGKSWVMENMVMPLLGNMNVHALGKSTEAGLRQTLNGDALPVVIDEAEIDDKNQKESMQSILTLMRQSSSESGASIFKGSVTGKSSQVYMRSCFLLSSIGVGTKHHADETRISVLDIRPDKGEGAKGRFEWIKKRVNQTLTKEFCDRLQARAIKMIPTIHRNKKILSGYIQLHVMDSARMADQYGALLAGAYALVSDDIITPEAAEEFVKILQSREDDTQSTEVTDHGDCLQAILQTKTQVRTTLNYSVYDSTFGELLAIITKNSPDIGIGEADIDRHLRLNGIRYNEKNNYIHFAINHSAIKAMLRNTPWEDNYTSMLRRIERAEVDTDKTTYTKGSHLRGTKIPAEMIFFGE